MAPKRAMPSASAAEKSKAVATLPHGGEGDTLEVREELGLGRFFVAARPLAAGELV